MPQYGRPVSDIENPGGWTVEPLWEKVDEEPFDDVDFLISPKSATGDSFTIGLSGITDPGVHVGHIVRIRAKTGVSGIFKYELMQGAVVIKDSGDVVLSTVFAEYSMTLSEAEVGNITDYPNLRVRGTAVTTQKNQRQNVSWIRFECPGGQQEILVAGTIDAISGVNGLIKATRKISGSAGAVSEVSGAVGVIRKISGGIDAVSGLVGNIILTGEGILISGAINGVSSLTGKVTGAFRLSGSILGTSNFLGKLTKIGEIVKNWHLKSSLLLHFIEHLKMLGGGR